MSIEDRRFLKSDRLRRTRDFSSLMRNSDSLWEDGVVLYYAPRKAGKSRMGVSISRKVLKHAAERNRAKRLVREFFRTRKSSVEKSFDVVIQVVDGCSVLDSNNLCVVLEKLFRRSGLLASA